MPQKPKFKLKKIIADDKTIGERIAVYRKKKGITQKQLAIKIGITQNLVSEYEINRVKISAEMLSQFAIALNISADELLGITDEQKKEDALGLRFTRRVNKLKQIPAPKLKTILRILDDLIKANS